MWVANKGSIIWCYSSIRFSTWSRDVFIFPTANEFTTLYQRGEFSGVIKEAINHIAKETRNWLAGNGAIKWINTGAGTFKERISQCAHFVFVQGKGKAGIVSQ